MECSEQRSEYKGDDSDILKASEIGDIGRVNACIDRNDNAVHITDDDLYTPLHRASYNNHVDVVKLLISRGADVNARTRDGWQAIHSASKWGNTDVVRVLLSFGADINATTNGGQTPLHLTASNADAHQLLQFLLFHPNIDIKIVNKAGDTACDVAQRCGPHYTLWDYV